MRAPTPHFEVGGDSRVSSCMAFARRMFESAEVKRILESAVELPRSKAAKLDKSERKRILELAKRGNSANAIARIVGRTEKTVRRAIKEHTT